MHLRNQSPSTLPRRNLKRFYSENASNVFRPHCAITGHVGFVFEENSVSEITWLSWRHRFPKLHFQNVFLPHENAKPAFSYSSGFQSVFEKLRFRDGSVWTEGLTGLVWTGLMGRLFTWSLTSMKNTSPFIESPECTTKECFNIWRLPAGLRSISLPF